MKEIDVFYLYGFVGIIIGIYYDIIAKNPMINSPHHGMEVFKHHKTETVFVIIGFAWQIIGMFIGDQRMMFVLYNLFFLAHFLVPISVFKEKKNKAIDTMICNLFILLIIYRHFKLQ